MTSNRRDRILQRLVERTSADVDASSLCEVCTEATGVSGAGIMLMSIDVPERGESSANPVTARLDELQYALGEGPCIDAHLSGLPVSEPNLHDPRVLRWPGLTEPALDIGVRAVFGFPLRVGAVRLGALSLHSEQIGPLKDEQYLDAMIIANLVSQAILLAEAQVAPASVVAELRAGADFQSVVGQAAGIAAVQLECTVGQALIRLRIYAFGRNRSLTDVAVDVVAHVVRFDGLNPLSSWLR